jgi:2-phosphoglycerate kinase
LLHLCQFQADIRQDIKSGIVIGFGEQVDALVCQFDGIVLFINHKKKLVIDDMHVLGLLLHEEVFRFQEKRLDACLAEELDQRLVLRKSAVCTQHLFSRFLHTLIVILGSSLSALASASNFVTRFLCALYSLTTLGLSSSNSLVLPFRRRS